MSDTELNPTDEQLTIDELTALQGDALELDGVPVESETAPEELTIPTSDLLMGVISPLFDVFAPNWSVSVEEKTALSCAYGDLIDKYFPDGLHSQYSIEITALTVTAMVMGSKIGTPRHKPEKKTDKPEQAKDDQTVDTVESGIKFPSELGLA